VLSWQLGMFEKGADVVWGKLSLVEVAYLEKAEAWPIGQEEAPIFYSGDTMAP
jgi:hypothetical protein